MATWTNLTENFRRMDIKAAATGALRATSEAMLDRNRRQMIEGKGRVKNIGRYRSRDYARMKNGMSSAAGFGNVDLRLTGSFQDRMKMSVTGESIVIDSSDSKSSDLVAKYGEQIFGLNVRNKSEYTEEALAPAFRSIIEKSTGLKFG